MNGEHRKNADDLHIEIRSVRALVAFAALLCKDVDAERIGKIADSLEDNVDRLKAARDAATPTQP